MAYYIYLEQMKITEFTIFGNMIHFDMNIWNKYVIQRVFSHNFHVTIVFISFIYFTIHIIQPKYSKSLN